MYFNQKHFVCFFYIRAHYTTIQLMPKAINFFHFTLLLLLVCCKKKQQKKTKRWEQQEEKMKKDIKQNRGVREWVFIRREYTALWTNSFCKMVNFISLILSIFSIIFLNYRSSYYKKNLFTVKKGNRKHIFCLATIFWCTIVFLKFMVSTLGKALFVEDKNWRVLLLVS